jgi:predicted CoA-substrate-specific enzyme activase
MTAAPFLAAIDSGSVSLRALFLDRQGAVLDSFCVAHEGKLAERLAELLSDCHARGIREIVATTDLPDAMGAQEPLSIRRFDARICLIEAAKAACPGLRTILHVGAERFFLLRFAPDGTYLDLKSNSSCAAGTGGFLDQQARRLSLEGSAEIGRLALASQGQAPRIASRCSVFAKTDLIHAQQEGFGLGEICDGLCRGLAATMCDSVLVEAPAEPFLFSGGVSLNGGVLRALEERLGFKAFVPELPDFLPARGAAIMRFAELSAPADGAQADAPASWKASAKHRQERIAARNERALARLAALAESGQSIPEAEARSFRYPPLELRYSEYPDFSSLESYVYAPKCSPDALPVEVDRYALLPPGTAKAWLGIDIGSTSTKAILLDEKGEPLAGFYTRTAGRPLDATRSIFESIEELAARHGSGFDVAGAATTGSGRKFIGVIIGTDLALDEISAHARAAAQLAEGIDTIIEIGGQDAKFTTLRQGAVTFSRMNSVCAAGTGSFIEEQAQKLGVSLADYAALALGTSAPAASDRCTVFMERDINHYLSKGYSTREILAAVLFSVRENYLLKVAEPASIGERICFQGATARNKALVAAFEEKLKKPIFVSRYCHLTGALGAALSLMEEKRGERGSSFRGLGIYKASIPMETETCELCRNHCRIRIATVGAEKVAFGFLCGRDYGTKKFVAKTQAGSFDALRKKALTGTETAATLPSIGYPFALQGVEEFFLWKKFFQELGIPFVSSESLDQAIALGKKESGAEFCAPVTAFHGHVRYLIGKADTLFIPVYLEKKEPERKERWRKYCYYTQFAAALVGPMLEKAENPPALISPLFLDRSDAHLVKAELWKALEPRYGAFLSPERVSKAFDNAEERFAAYKRNLAASFKPPEPGEIAVVLLGRPYTVLSPSMNKSIPELFSNLGISLFFQDMLPAEAQADAETEKLLDLVHWNYAALVLKAASFCASAEGIYPVFVTSFKCAPDSFAQEYLSRIMEKAGKPYLILQLDEHDSNVGYETRIEAAIRSFRNHRAARSRIDAGNALPIAPLMADSMKGKKILMPAWDPVAIRLLAASLRHAGYDARALEETPELVSEGLKSNTGQCIPVNVIAHEYADYLRRHAIKPEDAMLWMIKAGWACNIGMYPAFIRSLLEKEGGGMEKAGVYVGDLTMIELGPMVTGRAYFAYLFAGYIHRLVCRVRPYEVNPGQTDAAAERALEIFEAGLEGKLPFKKAARAVGTLFKTIPRDESGGRRTKVAIFGDLYLRDNPIMNQDLVKAIEAAGGEVVVISYAEYTKIVCSGHFKHWIKEQKYPEFVFFRALIAALQLLEDIFADGKDGLGLPSIRYEHVDVGAFFEPFGIRLEQEGETYDNILKVHRLMKTYPDLGLFVHTSPAFCCPSLVTEALAPKIEEVTGVPVVNIIYDGTSAYRNDVLAPYLRYPRKGIQAKKKPEKR